VRFVNGVFAALDGTLRINLMASSCLCYSNTPHALFANNGMVWVSVPKMTHMLQSQRVVTWLCNPLNSQLNPSANTESSKCWLESLNRSLYQVLGSSCPIRSNGKRRQLRMNTTDPKKIQSSKCDTSDKEQSMTMTADEASTKAEQLKGNRIQYSSQTPFFFKRP
jgi:hypothetical protein